MSVSSFDQDKAWAGRLGHVRDVVRQRLVTSQLLAHLPKPAKGQLVVDVGCGQGTQVLALAEQGYQVIGIDPSPELLKRAHQALSVSSPEIQSLVTFKNGDLKSLGLAIAEPADALLCHGVLMYLPSLKESLSLLTNHLAEGGVLSVLTRNQAGIAMRAGMEKRWSDVVTGFEAHQYTNNLGIEKVQADTPEKVISECETQGLDLVAWYGIRLFTDHWQTGEVSNDIETLIEAERQAGERDPYRRLAALTHVLATKPIESDQD